MTVSRRSDSYQEALEVVEAHDRVVVKLFHEDGLGLVEVRAYFLHQLGVDVAVLRQVVERIDGRELDGAHARKQEHGQLL